MKKLQIFTFTLVLFINLLACKQEEPAPINEPIDMDGQLVFQGVFKSSAHTTMGEAGIYSSETMKTLAFKMFKTDNGPDLRVYLAKDLNAGNFVDLGSLKSTSGQFSYEISNTLKIEEYKYVLVWCRQFSVLFGYAELKM
jgi:hypothetical protein